jgi:hypothetical protein
LRKEYLLGSIIIGISTDCSTLLSSPEEVHIFPPLLLIRL